MFWPAPGFTEKNHGPVCRSRGKTLPAPVSQQRGTLVSASAIPHCGMNIKNHSVSSKVYPHTPDVSIQRINAVRVSRSTPLCAMEGYSYSFIVVYATRAQWVCSREEDSAILAQFKSDISQSVNQSYTVSSVTDSYDRQKKGNRQFLTMLTLLCFATGSIWFSSIRRLDSLWRH